MKTVAETEGRGEPVIPKPGGCAGVAEGAAAGRGAEASSQGAAHSRVRGQDATERENSRQQQEQREKEPANPSEGPHFRMRPRNAWDTTWTGGAPSSRNCCMTWRSSFTSTKGLETKKEGGTSCCNGRCWSPGISRLCSSQLLSCVLSP